MKKKELEDLEKDELIKECENRGRLIKIILKEIKELEDRSQYNLHYNSISQADILPTAKASGVLRSHSHIALPFGGYQTPLANISFLSAIELCLTRQTHIGSRLHQHVQRVHTDTYLPAKRALKLQKLRAYLQDFTYSKIWKYNLISYQRTVISIAEILEKIKGNRRFHSTLKRSGFSRYCHK